MTDFSILECLNCGAILDSERSFCDDHCEHEYNYTNRTCSTCGGEFWDGGTSCTCDEDGEPAMDLTCPYCGREYDEIDYEYQICHHCKKENFDTDLPF